MICYLSYPLKREIPVYGNTRGEISIEPVKSLEQGNSCQVYRVGMENHWGTHVDCPAHFFLEGKKVNDYEADFWHFARPQVIRVEARPGQLIGNRDLPISIGNDTDLLLLRSGWGEFRGEEVYSLQNPGLDPAFGCWLRRGYPALRAVGIDWISASSYMHREIGREAHRAFLDPDGYGRPVLLVEDMCLMGDLHNLKDVWVSPLLLDGLDSAPCTVLGVFA